MQKRNKFFRCDYCGRFISYSDLDNKRAYVEMLTPDSAYTYETWEVAHVKCAERV